MFLHLLSDTDEGKSLEKTYSVKGHPSFVLMSSTGDVIDRWVGYKDPATFVSTLGSASADPTTLEQKRTRFAATPTAKDAALIAKIESASGLRSEALGHYKRALELDPGGPYQQPIFDQTMALHLKDGSDISLADVKTAADAALNAAGSTPQDKVMIAMGMRRVAEHAKDMKLIAPYVDAALVATKDDTSDDMKSMRNRLLIDQALYVQGDSSKALQLKRDAMPESWMTDAQQLNEFAWWCFENKLNLEEAEVLARKGVGLMGPGADRAQVLDTVAEICNLRGNCGEAVKLMKQAVKEDPDTEHYQKQLERFEKILAGQT